MFIKNGAREKSDARARSIGLNRVTVTLYLTPLPRSGFGLRLRSPGERRRPERAPDRLCAPQLGPLAGRGGESKGLSKGVK